MKERDPHKKEVVVIAVLCIEEARAALLTSGKFDACTGSDDTVIDKRNGVQVRFIPISTKN